MQQSVNFSAREVMYKLRSNVNNRSNMTFRLGGTRVLHYVCTLKSPCMSGAEIAMPFKVGTLLAISAQRSNIIFAIFKHLNVCDSYANDGGVALQ